MNLKAIMGILLLASANAVAATGVSGVVYVSPAQPGPQRIGEPSRVPMRDASIQVLDTQRRVVARAVTGVDGRFSVTLPPGEYSVEVDVGTARLPRCGAAPASVREGQVADVELECDSGMR
jgi:hypothetical protein